VPMAISRAASESSHTAIGAEAGCKYGRRTSCDPQYPSLPKCSRNSAIRNHRPRCPTSLRRSAHVETVAPTREANHLHSAVNRRLLARQHQVPNLSIAEIKHTSPEVGLEQRLNVLNHRVHQVDELGDLDMSRRHFSTSWRRMPSVLASSIRKGCARRGSHTRIGCRNLVTPPGRTREPHRLDDREAGIKKRNDSGRSASVRLRTLSNRPYNHANLVPHHRHSAWRLRSHRSDLRVRYRPRESGPRHEAQPRCGTQSPA
jgi:hypothetical protein